MKSIVLLVVDHGETTDPLAEIIGSAMDQPGVVVNYSLSCDVTEHQATSLLARVNNINS